MKVWSYFVCGLLCSLWAQKAFAYDKLVLIRHAEKVDDSHDPLLSELGKARAQQLAKVLADTGISAIYTTEFKRTMATAEPLAQQFKIKPLVIPAKNLDQLLQTLRNDKSRDAALVIGHSNTIPELIKRFGSSPVVTIQDNEFDRLFLLTSIQEKEPVLTQLRY